MLSITQLIKQLIYILGTLIVGWILVHFMAVFGLFLAAALPILHLFFYPHILCFWCRLKGGKHFFSHSLIDAGLMLFVTLFSIGVVYGEAMLLSRAVNLGETPTVSFVIPSVRSYRLKETFSVPIDIKPVESPINVVQVDLSFDPIMLKIIGIDLSDSFASIIVQKEYNNDLGYVRLAVGVPNPGYMGKEAHVGKIYFKTLKAGSAELKFLDSSLVLANNGKGSNVLKDLGTIPLIILPEEIPVDEENRQLDILTNKQILGDQTSSDQLSFTVYQEDLPKPFANVLGDSSMPAPIVPSAKPGYLSRFRGTLHNLDSQILEFWRNLLPD